MTPARRSSTSAASRTVFDAPTCRNSPASFSSKAPLYLNGSRLDTVGEGDARNRFAKACQELISFAFPNLRMLKGATMRPHCRRPCLIPTIFSPAATKRLRRLNRRS